MLPLRSPSSPAVAAVQGTRMKWMNNTYEKRFRQRLGEALRTGWACLLVGVTLEYVPAVKNLMVISVLSYVIAVLVSGPTLGTVLRNSVGLLTVAVPSLLSAMVVLQVLKPPISKLAAIVCIGISSFFITYLSNTNLLGRRSALAQLSILYIYAHYERDMNVLTFPLRMIGPDILGASLSIVATLLPFPQLAMWEVCKSADAAARGTWEVFNSAVNAFSAEDTYTFGSMYLHSKMLASASTDVMTGLKAKQVNVAWEMGTRRLRPALKRTTKILAGLNQHLTGMELAMESGHHLNAPAILRNSLRAPLEKVVAVSKSLLEYGVELGTSKMAGLDSTEHKVRKHLLVQEAREVLNTFDANLSEARRKAFYRFHDDNVNDGGGLVTETESGVGEGGIQWSDHRTTSDHLAHVKRKFRGRVSSYFFLFNVKLYMSEVLNLVEHSVPFYQTATKMHQIARSQPAGVDREKSVHGCNSADECLSSTNDTEERREINGEETSPPPDVQTEAAGRNSSANLGTTRRRGSAAIFSEDHFVAAARGNHASVLRRQCTHRRGSAAATMMSSKLRRTTSTESSTESRKLLWAWALLLRAASGFRQHLSKWGATRAQFRRSSKIALSMVLAAIFSNMVVSHEEHAFWGTVTVAFMIGNYQGGSWRTASLRLQGTMLGGIYGYLALTATKNHSWANLLVLVPWVVLSTFVRYSPDYGYSGLVSAFTAAILIQGDFEKDIKKYAMDRITETFIGVLAFVFVETVIFPERAVRLVRIELVSSLTGLRDCVAAIVAVYTEQECLECRTLAVNEIKKLEQQLRASFARQTALRAEACLEPDLWFVPFPGEIYSNLIAIEGRMLDLLFFMVCSLHATTEDGSTEHMQKLLDTQRSSLTALQEEVLSTIDCLQQVLQLQVQGPSAWSRFKHWILKHLKMVAGCSTDIEKQQKSHPEQQQQQQQPLHPLLLLNYPRRHVDGSPLNLKSTMDRFEQSFEDTVEGLIASNRVLPGSPLICNSVMLSFGSLTFSLHSLLRETVHLERAVHELVQAENPWSVLDFWDAHSVTQLWQQQVSVKA